MPRLPAFTVNKFPFKDTLRHRRSLRTRDAHIPRTARLMDVEVMRGDGQRLTPTRNGQILDVNPLRDDTQTCLRQLERTPPPAANSCAATSSA